MYVMSSSYCHQNWVPEIQSENFWDSNTQNLNFLILADIWATSQVLKYVYCVVLKGDPWGVSAAHRKLGPSILPAGAWRPFPGAARSPIMTFHTQLLYVYWWVTNMRTDEKMIIISFKTCKSFQSQELSFSISGTQFWWQYEEDMTYITPHQGQDYY